MGIPWWSNCYDAVLPLQGAPVRELRSSMPQSVARRKRKGCFLRGCSRCDKFSSFCILVTMRNSGDYSTAIDYVFQLPVPPAILFSSMICPDCGRGIEATFKFCPYCGKPLPTEKHAGSQSFVKPFASSSQGKKRAVVLLPGGGAMCVCACI